MNVNDETMDAIRQQYEVMDRIIKNVQYDGKAIKAESWEAFQEIRLLRQAVEQVTELHRPIGFDLDGRPFDCAEDGFSWPCPTLRAIAAAEQSDDPTATS